MAIKTILILIYSVSNIVTVPMPEQTVMCPEFILDYTVENTMIAMILCTEMPLNAYSNSLVTALPK